jgi:immune inhibitor A
MDRPHEIIHPVEYYKNILFDGSSSLKKWLEENSYGQYSITGEVYGWYSSALKEGDNAILLITDIMSRFAESHDLSLYDIEDKYDIDGDGNYWEPDGIIDHVIFVHAGNGAEYSGIHGNQIWSHHGMINLEVTDMNGKKFKIGEYSINSEFNPMGIFAHEYGHDLGLPDLYIPHDETVRVGSIGNWGDDGNWGMA